MTITLHSIPKLFSADDEIIFYKRELFKTSDTLHAGILTGDIIAHDIFGNQMDPADAASQLLSMVDSPVELSIPDAISYNMEIGRQVLALWREYSIVKSAELGISGKGLEQLTSFHLIIDALLSGMLWEASAMVLQIPTDEVVTDYIKTRFSQACLSADRLP